nr:hypothetical protein [Tanacetum cinerariifolium]
GTWGCEGKDLVLVRYREVWSVEKINSKQGEKGRNAKEAKGSRGTWGCEGKDLVLVRYREVWSVEKINTVNMSLIDINASLTEHNLHQQCKRFSRDVMFGSAPFIFDLIGLIGVISNMIKVTTVKACFFLYDKSSTYLTKGFFIASTLFVVDLSAALSTAFTNLLQVEGRLVEQKEREVKYIEKIKTLEFYNESNNKCIKILKKKLETLKEEKEGVDGKLAGLLTTLKDLDNLIKSQRSDKNNEGLGYSVVPLPIAQIYSSPKKDLSWTGLPEFADDTITDYSRTLPTIETVNMSLTDINASLTEHNLHQQCKLFSRGNSSTQQWEHFFTSSGKITLAVGTILHYQWQNNCSSRNSAVGMIFTKSGKILH